MCVCVSQAGLQVFLLLVAFLSVPVLLLGKPLYLYWLHKGRNRLGMYRVRLLSVCVCVSVYLPNPCFLKGYS